MNKQFYMTYARSRPNQIVPWVEKHQVPLLTNAMHRWSNARETFLHMWKYDTPRMIDAGGYNVQATWVKNKPGSIREERDSDVPFYPWSVEEYHEWLQEHDEWFDWATVMDYACEERFNELWDVEKRIEATLDRTIEHFNKNPSYNLLPVLQGRSIDDYVWFYEQLEDYGIPCEYVGVGTICRLSSEKKIVDIEHKIRERTNVKRLHGFGAKIKAFTHGATFDTADSQAWVYEPSNGKCILDRGSRLEAFPMKDDSKTRTVESFKNYYSYVTRLQQGVSAVDYRSDDDLLSAAADATTVVE